MQEPDRAVFLHKARSLNDARRAIIKAQRDQTNPVTTAPPYLKDRVRTNADLPSMDVVRTGSNRLEREILEHFVDGDCNPDIFIGLMKMLVPKWHESRH